MRHLFAAYAASLPVDLDYQDFGSEMAELPGKYAPPEGELLVAWDSVDLPVACIGMRPLDDGETCEMKRLYVVPAARSFGLGKALTETVIHLAKDRGYSFLRLDTLPTMTAAASLYERTGFHLSMPITVRRRPVRFSWKWISRGSVPFYLLFDRSALLIRLAGADQRSFDWCGQERARICGLWQARRIFLGRPKR